MSNVLVDIETGSATLVVDSPTHGTFVSLIDFDEVARIAVHKWDISKRKNKVYFQARIKGHDGRRVPIRLHRFILNAPKGMVVDHIDTNNAFDNRRSNLRVCT